MPPNEVVHGFFFYPRGGSAQVVRYLGRALDRAGWSVRLVAGSAGSLGEGRHASTFFDGLGVRAVDYAPALAAWARGEDPITQPVPLHPSYEDRAGAPDRAFPRVAPALAERQVAVWAQALAAAAPERAAVIHLHHLTPVHDAVERHWPAVPVVTQLHGTELLLLEEIERGTRTHDWPHAAYWADRFRHAAQRSAAVLALSPDHAARAVRTLRLPEDRVTVVPNGVDTERFDRLELSLDQRLDLLSRWLVEEPRGWDETGVPGSIRYAERDLAAFLDDGRPVPVLLYVGRFTAVKRLPLLLEAYAEVRARFRELGAPVPPLLVWGGHPGEWEGEHPYAVARRVGTDGIFFVGWREHEDLRLALGCVDLLVAPSVGEAFGAVYLEAMAAGVPVVATRTGGPPSFLNRDPERPDGWLIAPDDADALVGAIRHALDDPRDRAARGAAAHRTVRRRYSWTAVAEEVIGVYERVRAAGRT